MGDNREVGDAKVVAVAFDLQGLDGPGPDFDSPANVRC